MERATKRQRRRLRGKPGWLALAFPGRVEMVAPVYKSIIHTDSTITVQKKCIWCSKLAEVTLPMKPYFRWTLSDKPIQEMLPELSADEREILISGSHPACWPEDEDGDDYDYGTQLS